MNNTIHKCIVIVSAGVLILLSILSPWVLGDSNGFLKGFVNHELLNFLGVIVTISLASCANLHLTLNRMVEIVKSECFNSTKDKIKESAKILVYLLVASVAVVVIKPLALGGEIKNSIFNSMAIMIIVYNIIILSDITKTILNIPPFIDSDDEKNNNA